MSEKEEHTTHEEDEEEESETDLDETYEPSDIGDTPRPEAGEGEEEEGQEGETTEKKEPDPNPLSTDQLHGNSICMLQSIGEGLSCAYVRMDVPNRKLTDISMLDKYIHLKFLDISQNYLDDITPVSAMTNLVSINASKNRLKHLHLEPLPFLQSANFSNNKLTSFEGLSHPNLEKVNLSSNKIQQIHFTDPNRLPALLVLDLRDNKLETLEGAYPPNLQEIYVPSNLLKTVGRMVNVDKLQKLHIRDNQLENLDGIDSSDFKSLTYLNLRNNGIEEPKDLKKLRSIGTITDIILDGNPIADWDEYRDVALGAIGAGEKIQRLDKDKILPEDLVYAKEAMVKLDAQEEELSANGLSETADKSTHAEISFSLQANITEL